MLLCFFTLSLATAITQAARAQSAEDQRFQVELILEDGGRELSCKINSAALSIARYPAGSTFSAAAPDTTITQRPVTTATAENMMGDAVFINIDAPTFPAEMLKALTKRQAQLTGKIVVTDTYSRTIAKTINFDKALLNSFSDQILAYGYAGHMGNMTIAFTCKTVTINGTVIEP
ncbi:hypothetical protein PQ465_07250 [Sphingobacterium oryzagri]|uniref:YceI family protein n=1 Tax=Sphingobacterium oryzagri TaxID=3025669 RepID=A0ABY7WP17_9SPHI|nr:hypothetical protein [Sphingobacterium sp. KACC 22765]WDF70166.1 hypothetical protein PQ465_07250 [Sphingobacterium sp. KACC 22765]